MGNKSFLETPIFSIIGWNVCGIGDVATFLQDLDSEAVWDVMLFQEYMHSEQQLESVVGGHTVLAFPTLDTGCRGLGIVIHSRNSLSFKEAPVARGRAAGVRLIVEGQPFFLITAHLQPTEH
eukprot:11201039-Lingulodinium_polyedra.AAC.1